ncbi:phage terminase large subunit [Fusobacterium nucleatum]|uniref:phage terminase large subunit n=1 Tax=Fusobacterium nucleatum TaxID=851 RepID=UPI00201A6CA9|nr:terminase [Fusobacterium nucleatum YWH7056]
MEANREAIRRAKLELARREFFFYCYLKAPDFYKYERQFLVDLCNDLQNFLTSDDEVLILNLPPRHGKSRTVGNLVEWLLGRDINAKIMTGSYNETLSTTFSKNVRNTIQEVKADKDKIVFSDIFPGVSIKQGDGAMNLWSLEGGYNNYLATAPGGTATGFGCSLMIIDDLIKNAEEAYNANVLDKHWEWYSQTMLSRLEEGGKIIIIMTRWVSGDLAGRAIEHYKAEGKKIKHIKMKAVQDDKGTMLCDEILSYKSYLSKARAMGPEIASANYQQEPIDIKGRLYGEFKTYVDLPKEKVIKISSYCDTADTGEDFLCNIIYADCKDSAYILDVIYTKEAMEITEPMVAEVYKKFNVNVADIESNNGGRAFARNVERITRDKGNYKTVIKWFHQSGNKIARILSNSAWVNNNIYMPIDWKNKWSEFAKDIISYQKEGKNKHDDGPDALTGVAEKVINRNEVRTIDRNVLGIR